MDVTIAILPLKNLSADTSFKLLMEGFESELVINLSRFIGLSIIAPESIHRMSEDGEPDAIAKLGVNYTLSLSYRILKWELRIGLQLVRVKDAKIIFATTYSESVETMLDLQDDMVKQIVNSIQQQIDFDLLSFSYKKGSVELAAYENYLLGMDALKKGSLEHDMMARKYFEAALSINADYARAYTGLSLSYFNEWSCQLWDRWDVSKSGARNYALKALEIDAQDYIALAVAGRTSLFSEEYEKAEHYLRKSVRINPNDANNLVHVAYSIIFLGLANEAEKLYLRACKLNPLHPDWYFVYGASIYFETGDFQKAVELGEKLDSNMAWVDFPAYMAAAYFHLGEFHKMQAHWNSYLKLFSKSILKTAAINEEAALQWQIKVNPYKNKTNLKAFWEYISVHSGYKIVHTTRLPASKSASFVKKGELWEVSYNGHTAIIKDSKGVNDIYWLLSCPHKEVHCLEIAGGGGLQEVGIEIFDEKAKSNYQRRILKLQEEISEAEMLGNAGKIADLQEEYDQLIDQLSSAMGLAGKPRMTSSTVEKARASVTLRIKSSIKKLEKAHPHLAKHFAASIKTGTFCSYKSEFSIDWEL